MLLGVAKVQPKIHNVFMHALDVVALLVSASGVVGAATTTVLQLRHYPTEQLWIRDQRLRPQRLRPRVLGFVFLMMAVGGAAWTEKDLGFLPMGIIGVLFWAATLLPVVMHNRKTDQRDTETEYDTSEVAHRPPSREA